MKTIDLQRLTGRPRLPGGNTRASIARRWLMETGAAGAISTKLSGIESAASPESLVSVDKSEYGLQGYATRVDGWLK